MLLPGNASPKLPSIPGRTKSQIAPAALAPAAEESHVAPSLSHELKRQARVAYNEWFAKSLVTNVSCRPDSDGTKLWGTCRAIATFTTNRCTWTGLGAFLQFLFDECFCSIVALEELFDDVPGGVDNGWWCVDGHRIFLTHTHEQLIVTN
eukprot:2031468-Amphidinium_carterae.1